MWGRENSVKQADRPIKPVPPEALEAARGRKALLGAGDGHLEALAERTGLREKYLRYEVLPLALSSDALRRALALGMPMRQVQQLKRRLEQGELSQEQLETALASPGPQQALRKGQRRGLGGRFRPTPCCCGCLRRRARRGPKPWPTRPSAYVGRWLAGRTRSWATVMLLRVHVRPPRFGGGSISS